MKWATMILAFIVLVLVCFGIVVQASISDVPGKSLNGDPVHFLRNQILYFGVAFAACIVIASIKPEVWARRDVIGLLILFTIVALMVVHVPGLGKVTKGSARWISLMGISIQPSEFVKIAVIVLMACWQGRPQCRNESFVQGAVIPLGWLLFVSLCFFLQPDYGSVIMLCAVNGALMLVAGVRFVHLLPFALAGMVVLAILVSNDPERLSRVNSIRSVTTDQAANDDDYQLRQSLAALEIGGLKGLGFGNSVFKQSYLPESHTDFVFAMIGEEWGFITVMICLTLFWVIFLLGMWISLRAPTPFTRLLAFGMTLHIGLCAGVNLGVVTGVLPTKGLALPFLSYGGSSLVSSSVAIGFIMAIGWRCLPPLRKPRSASIPDKKVWIS